MHKLRYMTLGGLLMFVGMLTASVLMQSLIAQRSNRFGEIECSKLTVIDDNGHSTSIEGGGILVRGKDNSPKVMVGINPHGRGAVSIIEKFVPLAILSVEEHGGEIFLFGTDWLPKARLGVDKHGGSVHIIGADVNGEWEEGEGGVAISIDELGNGTIAIRDKDGNQK